MSAHDAIILAGFLELTADVQLGSAILLPSGVEDNFVAELCPETRYQQFGILTLRMNESRHRVLVIPNCAFYTAARHQNHGRTWAYRLIPRRTLLMP